MASNKIREISQVLEREEHSLTTAIKHANQDLEEVGVSCRDAEAEAEAEAEAGGSGSLSMEAEAEAEAQFQN